MAWESDSHLFGGSSNFTAVWSLRPVPALVVEVPSRFISQFLAPNNGNLDVQFTPLRPSAVTKQASRRILVVDDNVDGAIGLAILLKCMGHQTMTAHTGQDGLEIARSFRPEIIFLDIGLPGMSGYELSRIIRSEAEIAGAKLVALTGWGRNKTNSEPPQQDSIFM